MKTIFTFFLFVSTQVVLGSEWRELLPASVQHVLDISLLQGGATPEVTTAIETILGELEKMKGTIKSAHKSTDSQINTKVEAVQKELDIEIQDQASAKSKDDTWVQCKSDEKGLRATYDKAIHDLKVAIKEKESACDFTKTSQGETAESKMSCTFKTGSETCTQKLEGLSTSSSNQVADLVKKVKEDVRIYNENVGKCNDAKTKVVEAQNAETQAQTNWNAKKGECAGAKKSLLVAICSLQRSFEAKCTAVSAWKALVQETTVKNGSGNSDVDRRSEYDAITTAECTLQGAKTSVAVADCGSASSYDSDVGVLKLQKEKVNGYNSGNYWNCNSPSPWTLNGSTWNVAAPVTSSNDYQMAPTTWDMTKACPDSSPPQMSCYRNQEVELRMLDIKTMDTMQGQGWTASGDLSVSLAGTAGSSGAILSLNCKSSSCTLAHALEVSTVMRVEATAASAQEMSLQIAQDTLKVEGAGTSKSGNYPFQKGDQFSVSLSEGFAMLQYEFLDCPSDWQMAA